MYVKSQCLHANKLPGFLDGYGHSSIWLYYMQRVHEGHDQCFQCGASKWQTCQEIYRQDVCKKKKKKLKKRRKKNTLTVHNWQKWKSTFPTCPCHEIYSEEAVCVKSYNYTWKITIFVNMCNLGQFLENFVNNCLIKIRI